jgi:acyl-[acyl carrier protein]--UDP-N-acetylglucosamine O-acyltransferase
MKNSASITGYIYVNGNVEFKNNMTLVGSIAATGNVYFGKNNASITFQNLGEGGTNNPPGFSTSNQSLQLQSWQEVAPP